MKKILLFLILFTLNSCGGGVTPVAYTRFVTSGTQYACYSSDMYGTQRAHIEIYKD